VTTFRDDLERDRQAKSPTVAAVVAYAAKLRGVADHQTAADPYAHPYRPSEAAARKLSQRLGPDGALEHLARQALKARTVQAEQETLASRAQGRHERHRKQSDRDADRERQGLSLGRRLDMALASLQVISSAPVGKPTGDTVHGGERDTRPPRSDDPGRRASQTATLAVRTVERELDLARRRQLQQVGRFTDRDERLRQLGGLDAVQVSVADPAQGTPRMVRERRRELGLDVETGASNRREAA